MIFDYNAHQYFHDEFSSFIQSIKKDSTMTSEKNQRPLYIPYAGPSLLETPLLNKGSAFSEEERSHFNLTGLLPPRFESIDEQVERAYMQYRSFDTNLNKHIYLRAIHDNNETLFFKLVQAHLADAYYIYANSW